MESRDAAGIDAFRAAIEVGVADIDRGDFTDFASAADLEVYLTSLHSDIPEQPVDKA